MWAVVANTAMIGGLEHAADWWRDGVVMPTLTHLGVTVEEFTAQVNKTIAEEIKLAERASAEGSGAHE